MKSAAFWGMTPCSPLKADGLYTCLILVPCLAYSSTLKMEETRSSGTSVDFQWTAWRYIAEDKSPRGKIFFFKKYSI
jgi:hypothetical protein